MGASPSVMHTAHAVDAYKQFAKPEERNAYHVPSPSQRVSLGCFAAGAGATTPQADELLLKVRKID